ncbi:Hypothetical protein R9X50_00258000 [Acrodontium crateriforme]|uniref:Mid2 domain-containing protein n=1 Tax=Acrodontium crateriforme TaxID=150365 RepID=A0AAQ3M791_9PEZI|nr:Hypothetical protein R9X50_00258000 [Acrodontium crateriforme]
MAFLPPLPPPLALVGVFRSRSQDILPLTMDLSLIVFDEFAIGTTAQASVSTLAASPSPSIEPFQSSPWAAVLDSCWRAAFEETPMSNDISCNSGSIVSVLIHVESHATDCSRSLATQVRDAYSSYCSSAVKAAASSTSTSFITNGFVVVSLTTDSNSLNLLTSTAQITSIVPTSSDETAIAPSTTPASALKTMPTRTSLPLEQKSSGLSGNAIVGLGVGVGVGIVLVLGIAAAILLLRKRRKAQGPYGAVLSADKGGVNDGNSPDMGSREMRTAPYESPFLPPIVVPAMKPLPATPVAFEPQQMSPIDAESDIRLSDDFKPAPSSLVLYNSDHIHAMGEHDQEPPSPVSPMTPTGSRPASFRMGPHIHDEL